MLSVGARIIAAFKLLFTGRLPGDVLAALLLDQPDAGQARIAARACAATATARRRCRRSRRAAARSAAA